MFADDGPVFDKFVFRKLLEYLDQGLAEVIERRRTYDIVIGYYEAPIYRWLISRHGDFVINNEICVSGCWMNLSEPRSRKLAQVSAEYAVLKKLGA